MNQAPETMEGWYALHDLRQIDWSAWTALTPAQQEDILDEAVRFFEAATAVKDGGEGSSALYSVLGHKGDLLLVHFRPTVKELHDLELAFNKTRLAHFTRQTYSYVSITELSKYGSGERGGDETPEARAFIERRLKPAIPDTSHVCFYPMNKRRGEVNNWYSLPIEQRMELMRAHGMTGRKYAGRVTQVITGSVGFDDWEWGVTLFANDPLDFKKLVYEMRFDEVSAKYAEFGPFFVGLRMAPADLRGYLTK